MKAEEWKRHSLPLRIMLLAAEHWRVPDVLLVRCVPKEELSLTCAVPGTLQYTEELTPGADRLSVLVCECSRDLVQMCHVVRGPSR